MAQGRDVNRYRVEGGWMVDCAYCGHTFESKRADASYCMPSHRVAASREDEKLNNYIEYLATIGREARSKADRYSRSDKLYKAMLELQSQIAAAVATFED